MNLDKSSTEVFKNKTIMVTGGSRGIGEATAKMFLDAGAKVAALGRSVERFNSPSNLLKIVCDVSDEAEVQNAFEKVLLEYGLVDILINNAGIFEAHDEIENLTKKSWDYQISVNLTGSFLCAREAFKHMSKKGGVIVNVASLAGIKGVEKFSGMLPYIVSKHGVIGLTESLAIEGKSNGIRVNCIAPGAVQTDMLKKAAPHLKTRTLPVDIAKIILFLSDPLQKFSGTILEVHSNE